MFAVPTAFVRASSSQSSGSLYDAAACTTISGSNSSNKLVDALRVRDRVLDEAKPLVLGERVVARGREVVDHEDVVAALEQAVGDVRRDEAGAAGDQDSRHLLILAVSMGFAAGKDMHSNDAPPPEVPILFWIMATESDDDGVPRATQRATSGGRARSIRAGTCSATGRCSRA